MDNTSSPVEPAFTRVARVEDIPARKGRAFSVNGRSVVIFRVGDRVAAALDRCPHAGAPLSIGSLRGEEVTCAWHGWVFNVLDGASVPDTPGFALTLLPVKVEHGEILVAA